MECDRIVDEINDDWKESIIAKRMIRYSCFESSPTDLTMEVSRQISDKVMSRFHFSMCEISM